MEDTQSSEPEESTTRKHRSPLKLAGTAALVVLVGGLTIAFLQVQNIIPIGDGSATAGFSFLFAIILVCCAATGQTATYSQRIIGYQAQENKYQVGKDHFDRGEWEEALEVFKELLDPDEDHRRALYYGAQCYEKLGMWDEMKSYCELYIELIPDDKAVWEMLSTARKRLFEFGEADEAQEKADSFD